MLNNKYVDKLIFVLCNAASYPNLSISRLTALVIDVLFDVKSQSRDLQNQIHISQAALDKAALWLTKQQGVIQGAASEAGNINNKIFEVRLYN